MGACGSTNNKKQTTIKSNPIKSNQTTTHKDNQVNNKNINPSDTKLRASPPNTNIKPKINKIKFLIKDSESNKDLLNSSFNDNILLKEVFSEVNYDKNKDYDILDGNDQKLNIMD